MHRHILERSAQPGVDLGRLPPNHATEELADAIGAAVQEYGDPDAVVLFVVQPNERNSYDQQVSARMRHSLWQRPTVRQMPYVHRSLFLQAVMPSFSNQSCKPCFTIHRAFGNVPCVPCLKQTH